MGLVYRDHLGRVDAPDPYEADYVSIDLMENEDQGIDLINLPAYVWDSEFSAVPTGGGWFLVADDPDLSVLPGWLADGLVDQGVLP